MTGHFKRVNACVVIASNAGEPPHPVWWLNLRADPRATVQRGREVARVRAREASGEERARLWAKLIQLDRSYEIYRQRTTRQIPVVLLEPAAEA